VKLDRAIVRRVDRDPARQALVAGLVDFATRTGAILIAEGVETEAEVREVHRLGVPLAQGYRLGRPGLAASERRNSCRYCWRRVSRSKGSVSV